MDSLIMKYALGVVILAVLALIVQGDLISTSPIVIAGQVIAIILLLSSRAAFRKQQFRISAEPGTGPLVRQGPYKLLRHPMYVAALLFIWVSILGHWSTINGMIGVVVLAVVLRRISLEETILSGHYPDYQEYARQTKRIIPFVY